MANLDLPRRRSGLNLEQKYAKTAGPSPELKANIFSIFIFHWVAPFIRSSHKKVLQAEDLYDMNPREATLYCERNWMEVYDRETANNGRVSVWKLVKTCLGKEHIYSWITMPIWLCAVILQVFVLKALVTLSQKRKDGFKWWWGALLIAGMFLSSMVQSLSQHRNFTLGQKVGMKIRAGVCMAVFRKMSELRVVALDGTSSGQMLNLVTNDTQKLVDASTFFSYSIFSILDTIVIAAVAVAEMGVSALAGVLIICMGQPMQFQIAKSVAGLRRKAVIFTDARVRLLSETLVGVRVVKYNGWISPFLQKIADLRALELKWIRRAAYFRASTSAMKDGIAPLASLATFAVYVRIHDGHLNPSLAFTVLSLFSILVRVYSIAPLGLQYIGESMIALDRLQRLLDLPTGENLRSKEEKEEVRMKYPDVSIRVTGASFTWIPSPPAPTRNSSASQPEMNVHNMDLYLDNFENKTVEPTSASPSHSGIVKSTRSSFSGDTPPSLPGEVRSARPSLSGIVKSNRSSFSGEVKRSYTVDGMSTTLWGIDLTVKKGEMIAVVGSVGSGKSALLYALLGEMECLKGSVYMDEKVAYVPQQPWIWNDTLRNNIVFGCEYDESRYNDTVFACALDHDIARMPAGHDTEIGERGINISGGQKARVSLARACYSYSDVVLLDDPLAAVDVPTARHLMQHAICKALKGRTVVLVTHNKSSLEQCDRVVVIENGTLYEVQSKDEIKFVDEPEDRRSLIIGDKTALDDQPPSNGMKSSNERNENVLEGNKNSNTSTNKGGSTEGQIFERKTEKPEGGITSQEDRVEGVVTWKTYINYSKAGGFLFFSFVMLLMCCAQAVRVIVDYWVSVWTDNKYHLTSNIYLGSYACLVVGAIVLSLSRGLLFTKGAIKAANTMHSSMAMRVLRSPILFFDQNPVGRILNRFSKDQAMVDELLPTTAQQMFENLIGCSGSLIFIGVLLPWFLLCIPPFFGVLIYYQQAYVKASRELKRIDGLTRSPMYAHFSQALQGIASVRAYGVQSELHDHFASLIDANHRAFGLFVHTARWLGVRLDFAAAVCVTVVSLLVVLLRNNIGPGLAGVVLTQCLQLTGLFQYGVRLIADTENLFTSVERIQAYENLPSEADAQSPAGLITAEWPKDGKVEFIKYSMAYREDLPLVLNGITFEVKPKEKVGILGRTGAGKSSLVAALFRMVENKSCDGSILVDDVDLKSVGLDDLRQRISIIPQDPVLFRGTVRFNLDPFDSYSDENIFEALEKVHLTKKLKVVGLGLNSLVSENGENFSVGERQLLCLARSLLRRSKIIVMDEATAAVDGETDQLIQQTMRNVFYDCTVLTIAHRIDTVIDCDRVLILARGGFVAEFDTPANLLRRADGIESADQMKEHLFADMVFQCGPIVARQMREAAEAAESVRELKAAEVTTS